MKSSLLSVVLATVVAAGAISVTACHKAEDTAPDAGMAMAAVDAAPIATVDPNAMDAATADMGDAAPPTAETYEKAASAAVTNVQTATAELNKLEQEIGN